MGFLDNILGKTKKAEETPLEEEKKFEAKTESFSFESIPADTGSLKALPESSMDTPFKTAALTLLALCAYEKDADASLDMLQYLSGPRAMSTYEKGFIREHVKDVPYLPKSYFKGAVPENGYTPDEPFTVNVSDNPYSYDSEGYAVMHIVSGGADSPRQVKVRKAKDGKWYLWEQFLLVGIREPANDDPWA